MSYKMPYHNGDSYNLYYRNNKISKSLCSTLYETYIYTHFLVQCSKYTDIRNNLLGPVDINDASDEFIRHMKETDPKTLSNYIIAAYELRNVTLASK